MMRKPSRRALARPKTVRLDLVPILASVFIFIFFLLMSANFIKIFEIPSDVPLFSQATHDNKEKSLGLTIRISDNDIQILTGIPASVVKTVRKLNPNDYDLNTLHQTLLDLKKRYPKENVAILEPLNDISYDKLVQIMDEIRLLKHTDPELEEKTRVLFGDIVFGNI